MVVRGDWYGPLAASRKAAMSAGEHEQPRGSEPTLEQSLDDALGAPPSEPRHAGQAGTEELASPDGRGEEASANGGGQDAPRPALPSAQLVVVGGPETGRLIRLGSVETVLGRSEDVGGKVRDPSASQRHAKILWHDDGYLLVDLGSTNGTHLNGERLEGPTLLTHGDTIRIGQTALRFLCRGTRRERNATVPLDLQPPPPPGQAPRQDLVRYRDARLTSWGPRDPNAYGSWATNGTDWVIYVRTGLGYLKRYGTFLAVMTAVGASAGALHALIKPPLGAAYFEISLSRDGRANPVDQERATTFFVAAEKSFTSTRLIKETLTRLGAEPHPGAALAIQRRVSFQPLDKQELVWRGEYQEADAEHAKTFLTRHLEVYLEREFGKTLQVLQAQVSLLEEQVERSGQELRRTEEELAAFKKEHPGVVGTEGGAEQYAALGPLQTRRDDLRAQVERLQLELALNRKRLNSGDALLQGRVSSAGSYATSLQDVEKQLTEAKAAGLGEQHPQVKRLRQQARELAQLRDSTITAESTDIERRSNEGYVAVRERVRDLEVALRVATTELEQVDQRLGQLEGRVSQLPEAEARLSTLTRNYASTKDLHDRLYQKLRASRIQLKMERESMRGRYDLLTPPTPVHPDMITATAQRSTLGGLGMFFVAVVCAGTREAFRYLRSVL